VAAVVVVVVVVVLLLLLVDYSVIGVVATGGMDEGGGWLVRGDSRWMQVGGASTGKGCCAQTATSTPRYNRNAGTQSQRTGWSFGHMKGPPAAA